MTQKAASYLEPSAFSPVPGFTHWRAAHVSEVGSTNAALADFAAAYVQPDRHWLTAAKQLAGRGRRGRSWVSPAGNFHGSVCLIDPAINAKLHQLPLVAGIAVHSALTNILGDNGPRPQLKWPNDMLLDGAKCCGLLLENIARKDGKAMVIIGCGINVIAHPDDTPYRATHLGAHGFTGDLGLILQALCGALDEALALWDAGRGFAAVRANWLRNAHGLGRPIRVNLAQGGKEGVFETLDEDGFLILKTANGVSETISAGDVFFGA